MKQNDWVMGKLESTHVSLTRRRSEDAKDSALEDNWGTQVGARLDEWEDDTSFEEASIRLVIGLNELQPESSSDLENLIMTDGGTLVDILLQNDKPMAAVVDMPHVTISSFVGKIESTGLARYIEPNFGFSIRSYPNDPEWLKQWGPAKIQANYAWDTQAGDPSVLVAVIDTGVDWGHPDLTANYVSLGYDWVNDDPDPRDDHGHGTHCAGIIAAVMNNRIGIAGMAQVQIMAEKVLDSGGYGYSDQVANGIIHATNCGADIISMSIGSYGWSELLRDAINYAFNSGVLMVAAAGNEETNTKLYPAGYEEVIAVAASDRFDLPASFSNFGEWIELSAPGVDIFSTVSETHNPGLEYPYDYGSGTSMATPHVAGVAALIWSQYPNWTRDQVRTQLRYTADDLGYPGFDVNYGYGRINARRSVERGLLDHDLLLSKWETPHFVKLGNTAVLNTTVFNFGKEEEGNITVQFFGNGSLIDSTSISVLESFQSVNVSFLWSPVIEATYNLTSYVVVKPNETISSNNALSTHIPVRNAKIFRVPTNYSTIQTAIDATISGIGDTVQVEAGIYQEHIKIHKSVTVQGEDQNTTIIDGKGIGTSIQLTSLMIMRSRLYSTFGVNFTGFTLINGSMGIYVYRCKGGDIRNNLVSNFTESGVELLYSEMCTLKNNKINENRFNFYVEGSALSHYMHDVDTSNTIDGRPIHYLVSEYNKQITSDAGYVALVNSTNIEVENLDIRNSGQGTLLAYTTNSIIANMSVKDSYVGIDVISSSNNTIANNTILRSLFGVFLYAQSTYNNIIKNNINGNGESTGLAGVVASQGSSYNAIEKNIISTHQLWLGYGVALEYFSNNNTIFHNDFIDNNAHASVFSSFNNVWDDGYPSGGNYWKDYADSDHYCGQYQNETGGDGVWDTPYSIDQDNKDNYPIIINYGYWSDPIVGDVDFNRIVDMRDIGAVAYAFGSYPGHPRWIPIADINGDNKVDMKDIGRVAKNFGITR
jgi:parallel beta-helix repeat protein